jgi:hypothetical protein
MSQDRRLMDHQLDRLERMLERCIEADKATRKERRAELRAFRALQEQRKRLDDERRVQPDVFYEKLKILRKMQEQLKEELRGRSSTEDPES